MKYLLLWLALGMVSCGYAEMEVYTSADAAAGGDGSRRQPYQTLTQARDGIRAARQAGTLKSGESVTVYVESGVYRLNASFELSATDSGTAEAPTVYRKEKKVIALAAPHSYGINAGTWGAAQRRFFAMNAMEELDAPGEWYLDRSRKLLYFYPEADLSSAEIVLATLAEPLVRVNGAKHVKFLGLAFEYGHADGIVAQNTEHLEIAGCVVANLAGGGLSINGSANAVRSCDCFNLGKIGLQKDEYRRTLPSR